MFDLRREINRPNQLKFINSDTQINSELSTELPQAEKKTDWSEMRKNNKAETFQVGASVRI